MKNEPFERAARRMRPLLGTFVEVGVDCFASTRAAFESAFAAIEEVQRSLSFHDPESELSRLNRSAGEPVRLSRLAIHVLRLARALSLASGGLFNCTVGGALVRRGALPDHGGPPPLEAGIAMDIAIDGSEVKLARPLRITLDGIAKGYAVDRAVRALKRQGVCGAWINAGGDLRAFGTITLPVSRRREDGSLQMLGGLRDAALASSEVRVSVDERFPGQIIFVNGAPAACGSWSVLAHSAWRADALTKVAALAPHHGREDLLRGLGGRLIEVRESVC